MSTSHTDPQAICFTIPLLPHKTEADRSAMRSCWHGDRRAAYESSRRRLGITRESVWIQNMPDGDVAVVLLEARDVNAAIKGMGISDDPFDRWFREHARDVHGIDLEGVFPPLEQVLDFRSQAEIRQAEAARH